MLVLDEADRMLEEVRLSELSEGFSPGLIFGLPMY